MIDSAGSWAIAAVRKHAISARAGRCSTGTLERQASAGSRAGDLGSRSDIEGFREVAAVSIAPGGPYVHSDLQVSLQGGAPYG
jgi:hypothetical protein